MTPITAPWLGDILGQGCLIGQSGKSRSCDCPDWLVITNYISPGRAATRVLLLWLLLLLVGLDTEPLQVHHQNCSWQCEHTPETFHKALQRSSPTPHPWGCLEHPNLLTTILTHRTYVIQDKKLYIHRSSVVTVYFHKVSLGQWLWCP